jgi:hypothetical protein
LNGAATTAVGKSVGLTTTRSGHSGLSLVTGGLIGTDTPEFGEVGPLARTEHRAETANRAQQLRKILLLTLGFNVMKKSATFMAAPGGFDVTGVVLRNATVFWPILEHVLGSNKTEPTDTGPLFPRESQRIFLPGRQSLLIRLSGRRRGEPRNEVEDVLGNGTCR